MRVGGLGGGTASTLVCCTVEGILVQGLNCCYLWKKHERYRYLILQMIEMLDVVV